MNKEKMIALLDASVNELDHVKVEGHYSRKSMVVAVELMIQVVKALQEKPEEGESNGNIAEAE